MSTRSAPAVGEPFVWLTAMGLALCLTLAAGLLSVIVANGVTLFWPSRLERVTLTDGSVLLGIESKRQVKHQADSAKPTIEEVQYFTGNRDAGGSPFRWVDSASIRSTEQSADLVRIERQEYGDAIGTPVALRLRGADGKVTVLAATDPTFESELHRVLTESAARWDEIRHLEKDRIGANASEITALERQVRADPTQQEALAPRLASLKASYQELAEKAKDLRGRQNHHALVLRLADGKDRRIVLGKILEVTWPNRDGFLARCGAAAVRVGRFISESPREANTEGGIFPAIFGTFVMTLLMAVLVVPFGVIAAIYLREYARQGAAVRMVRIAVNNLAGVPSIVFGVFGLGFFVYFVGGGLDRLLFADALPTPTFGTGGLLWAALTLALMTVPVVIVATEESISAVPRGLREASLAMGASKWQTIQRIVLPGAVPGILTGMILAMARGAGEVAPLMLVGVVKLAPTLPITGDAPFLHLDQKFMHLGFHIFDLGFQSPDSEAARPMVFATTLFLIVLVVAMNLGAILIRDRLRRKFATSAF